MCICDASCKAQLNSIHTPGDKIHHSIRVRARWQISSLEEQRRHKSAARTLFAKIRFVHSAAAGHIFHHSTMALNQQRTAISLAN
jgi:hypothetical protein